MQEGVAPVGVGQSGPDVGRARALQNDREPGVGQQVLAGRVEGVVLRVLVDVQVADDARRARGRAGEVDVGGFAALQGEGRRLPGVEAVGAGIVAGDGDPVGSGAQVGEAVAAVVGGGRGVVRRAREDDGHAVQPDPVGAHAPAHAGGAEADAVEGDVRGLAARKGDALHGGGELVGAGVVAGDVQAVLAGAQFGEGVDPARVGGGGGGPARGSGEVDRDALEPLARHAHPSRDPAGAQIARVEAGDPRLVRLQAERLPRGGKRDVVGVEARDLERVVARAQVGQRVLAVGGGEGRRVRGAGEAHRDPADAGALGGHPSAHAGGADVGAGEDDVRGMPLGQNERRHRGVVEDGVAGVAADDDVVDAALDVPEDEGPAARRRCRGAVAQGDDDAVDSRALDRDLAADGAVDRTAVLVAAGH